MRKREALSLAMHLSWTMLFSLLLPLLAGAWLDKKWNTTPLFVLIGALVGILAATVGVARMILRAFPPAEDADPDEHAEAYSEEEPE
jgi:F0F1-type ATP synthase assembly protein I